MKLTNYHSHSIYCDGRANMETFVRFAISRGLKSYGFSSHAPLPFDTTWTMDKGDMECYIAEFNRLKEKYKDRIELYLGLEIDYLNESSNPSSQYFQQLPLDYRIGSVHLLYDGMGNVVDLDVPKEKFKRIVDTHFYHDIECVVRLYFERMRRMIDLGGFDIIGHFGKIRHNVVSYCPYLVTAVWYRKIVKDLIADIVRRDYIVEINTKDFMDTGRLYPDVKYFELLKKLNAKLVVNSDAHYPYKVDSGLEPTMRLLSEYGFKTVMQLEKGEWTEVAISSVEKA